MKTFLSILALFIFFTVSAFSQPIGTAMRSTNGFAFGTTTVGGRLLATNTIANGGTNKIDGALHIGPTHFLPAGRGELFTIYHDTTNPPGLYGATVYLASDFAYTTNINHLNAGFTSLVRAGSANTGSWTNNGYPGLMGYNTTIQPEIGSTGTIRRVAGYAATVGGTAPTDNGTKFDESVGFWFDTASVGNNLSNVIGGKFQGLAGGWNNCGLWLGIPQNTYPPTGNWGIWDETGYPSHFGGNIYGIGGTNGLTGKLSIGPVIGLNGSTNWLDITPGTLTTNTKAMSITATLSGSSIAESGSETIITGAGVGTATKRASLVRLSAGYAGAGISVAQEAFNLSSGIGASGFDVGPANYGTYSRVLATTTGDNVGVYGSAASSSNLNIGVFGRVTSSGNFPLLNVGVAGQGINSAGTALGGYFDLGSTTPTISHSAALMVDNRGSATNIMIWRDDQSIMGGIADGGVIHGDGSGLSNINSGQLWFTNSDAASSISNAYDVKLTGLLDVGNGLYGHGLGLSNAVDLIAGNCIVITTNANKRSFTIAVGNQTTNYIFWYTNTATANSAMTPYNIRASGSIQSTNTATANTALTLNGAATGGTGQVIAYRTNNSDKFTVDTRGVTTGAQLVANTDSGVLISSSGANAGFYYGNSTMAIAMPSERGIYWSTTADGTSGSYDTIINRSSSGTLLLSTNLIARGSGTFTNGATLGTLGTSVAAIRHGISGAMVLGSVTVTDAGCTANTRYFFSAHTLGTISIPGGYYASTRNAGTSFVITSSQATETSTIDWMAIEP